MLRIGLALIFLLVAEGIFAQPIGSNTNPTLYPSGTPTAGNCAKWGAAGSIIIDAGHPCSGGGGGCTGVINASTGCPMPMLGGA